MSFPLIVKEVFIYFQVKMVLSFMEHQERRQLIDLVLRRQRHWWAGIIQIVLYIEMATE